jgi:tetratricopeptide (TPR) repeat protein
MNIRCEARNVFPFLSMLFGALFVNGQMPRPWENLSRLVEQRQEADDFSGAESLRREALSAAEDQLGPNDKQVAPLLANLAQSLHFEGHDSDAEPLARRAFSIAQESGDQKLMGVTLNTLGVVLSGEGERARAEPLMRRSIALLEQSEGADSLDVGKAANNLATLYSDTQQYAKAKQEMARALPIYEKYFGPDHPVVASVLGNMFIILSQQHRTAEGEPYLRRALAIGEKVFPESLKMADLQLGLAALESSHGNFRESARILQKVIAIQEQRLGPEHPQLARTLVSYSYVLRRLHQKTEAEQAQNRASLILRSLR